MVKVFYLRLPKFINDNDYSYMEQFISKEKRDRIRNIKCKSTLNLLLFAELTIRMIIIKEKRVENSEIIFQVNRFGKPYLENKFINISFNISHTEGFIVCAVDRYEVGIDVEYRKLLSTYMDIAKRFFTESEYNMLRNTEIHKRLNLFYELWVVKESFIKFTGEGLSRKLNTFKIDFNERKIVSKYNGEICFFKNYYIDDVYSVSACSKLDSFDEIMNKILLDDVLNFFYNLKV